MNNNYDTINEPKMANVNLENSNATNLTVSNLTVSGLTANTVMLHDVNVFNQDEGSTISLFGNSSLILDGELFTAIELRELLLVLRELNKDHYPEKFI